MFRIVLLFAYLVACSAHAVLPLAHTIVAPVPYPHGLGLGLGYAGHGLTDHGYLGVGHLGYASHGFAGHGYASHGLLGHGHGAHHILKRSPHIVPVGHLGGIEHGAYPGHLSGVGHLGVVGHVGAPVHVAPIAPVAVSHQSRLDVRSSPALVAQVLPVVAPVAAPIIHAAPAHAGLAPLHYGGGHYGSAYPHLGHY